LLVRYPQRFSILCPMTPSTPWNNRNTVRAEAKALTAILRIIHGQVGYSVRRHRDGPGMGWFDEFLTVLEGLELPNAGVTVFQHLGL